MKQFSLEEFKKNPNRKVVTRSGWPVRVICTDKKGEYPVVALISDGDDREYMKMYKADGMCNRIKSPFDLFVEVEKKDGWINIFRHDGEIEGGIVFDTEKEAVEFFGKNDPRLIATVYIEWEE